VPWALLNSVEHTESFLKVRVQNLTPALLWFARMRLLPTGNWHAHEADLDLTHLATSAVVRDADGLASAVPLSDRFKTKFDAQELDGLQLSLLSGPSALMQPHDIQYYISVLMSRPAAQAVHAPPALGNIVPLGQLDILWHTQSSEPGRLLTSLRTHASCRDWYQYFCSICCVSCRLNNTRN
jgi:hypothetical protein